MTGAFLLPRLLNPKNKNPPSLAGHSLALVRQVYYCLYLTNVMNGLGWSVPFWAIDNFSAKGGGGNFDCPPKQCSSNKSSCPHFCGGLGGSPSFFFSASS